MKSIVLILAYFGEFPNYFDLWLKSAEFNSSIDFLIVTDSSLEGYSVPDNVYVINSSMTKMKEQIQILTDQEVSLEYPYKLVEYRPVFGELFQREISNYDFWGYVDSDIILGDIRGFFTEELLNSYDRVLTRGHFTLFRNVREMNRLYKIKHDYNDCFHFSDILKFHSVCAYDEWGWEFGYGLSEILLRKGIISYDEIIFADIDPYVYKFQLVNHKFGEAEYFVFDKGKIFAVNGCQSREFMYIHLQKRKMLNFVDKENHYYIYPDRFSLEKISDLTVEDQEKVFYKRKKRNKRKNILAKLKSDYLLMRLTMLFRRIKK